MTETEQHCGRNRARLCERKSENVRETERECQRVWERQSENRGRVCVIERGERKCGKNSDIERDRAKVCKKNTDTNLVCEYFIFYLYIQDLFSLVYKIQ